MRSPPQRIQYISGKIKINQNKCVELFFRDATNSQAFFEAISVIEFKGVVTNTGQSNGHYICDVKDVETKAWFRTDDHHDPIEIPVSSVSKLGYVVLYKRVWNNQILQQMLYFA